MNDSFPLTDSNGSTIQYPIVSEKDNFLYLADTFYLKGVKVNGFNILRVNRNNPGLYEDAERLFDESSKNWIQTGIFSSTTPDIPKILSERSDWLVTPREVTDYILRRNPFKM